MADRNDTPLSYPPSADFVAQANAGVELYREAEHDRLAFWAGQARRLTWATPFTEVLDYSAAPFADGSPTGSSTSPRTGAGEPAAGYLVVDAPWPAMARGIWGDRERFVDTYWSRFAEQGWYFAGDGARYDADGDIWVLGRIDDVMNVSGHRISTAEVESALIGHPAVAEAAVVGAADEQTGQHICAFVVLTAGYGGQADSGAAIVDELRARVADEISPIARPHDIHLVPELPKTRSGKIMRRLLRDVADGRELGDTSTLVDPGVFDAIRAAR